MDQPLTTIAAAADQAAGNATDQTSPFRRASATLRSLGAARLPVLAATALGLFGSFAFPLLRVAEPHYTLDCVAYPVQQPEPGSLPKVFDGSTAGWVANEMPM
jgi:hypothetical protein